MMLVNVITKRLHIRACKCSISTLFAQEGGYGFNPTADSGSALLYMWHVSKYLKYLLNDLSANQNNTNSAETMARTKFSCDTFAK